MKFAQIVTLRFGIGIFDETWLEHRLALFEATMLPSLKAQAPAEFHVGIQIDQKLPERYVSALRRGIDDLPNASLRPIELHRARHLDHLQHIEEVCRATEATHFISTRCDDDDALTPRVFVDIQDEARNAIEGGAPGAYVAIRNGLRAALDAGLGAWVNHASNGIGLSIVLPAGDARTIYSMSHSHLPAYAEKEGWAARYVEKDRGRWLYSFHKFSDTDFTAKLDWVRRVALSHEEYDAAIALFPLNFERLEEWRVLERAAGGRIDGRITEQLNLIEKQIIAAYARKAEAAVIASLHEQRASLGSRITVAS